MLPFVFKNLNITDYFTALPARGVTINELIILYSYNQTSFDLSVASCERPICVLVFFSCVFSMYFFVYMEDMYTKT